MIISLALQAVLLLAPSCLAQTSVSIIEQISVFDIFGRRVCAFGSDEPWSENAVRYVPRSLTDQLTNQHIPSAGYYVFIREDECTPQESVSPSFARIPHDLSLREMDFRAKEGQPEKARATAWDASPQEELWFEDVTDSFLPADAWPAEDVAVADLNGDGMTDVVFSLSVLGCPGPQERYIPRLWLQNSDGVFTDETLDRIPSMAMPSHEVELFDIDGDGDVDVFLAGSGAEGYPPAAVLVNGGDGYFSNESSERLPDLGESCFVWVAEPGRLDDNESIDLVLLVASILSSDVAPVMLLNDGDGFFSVDTEGRIPEADYGYFDVAVLDIDNDGWDDMLFASVENTGVSQGRTACFHNVGDGYFEDETEARIPEGATATRCIAVADVEGDGDQDFLEVGFTLLDQPVSLFLNNGSGYFIRVGIPCPENCRWINDAVLSPFNRDSNADIFLANVNLGAVGSDILLMNNGDNSFTDASDVLPDRVDFTTSCVLLDHNTDTVVDVFLANAGQSPESGELSGQNALYRNHPGDSLLVGHLGTPIDTQWLRLGPTIPNPFDGKTTITYFLPNPGTVRLTIHDCSGRLHETLVCEPRLSGRHSVTWMAHDSPSGIYICRLSIDSSSERSERLLCIR